MCDYCENNYKELLNGKGYFDVFFDDGELEVYFESHHDSGMISIKFNYCPMCGREL